MWEVEGTSDEMGKLKQTKEIKANSELTWATTGLFEEASMLLNERRNFSGGCTYKKTESSSSAANAISTLIKGGAVETL